MIDKLLDDLNLKLQTIKKTSDKISYFRAVVFLLILITLFFLDKSGILYLTILCSILFVFLIIKHINISSIISELSYKIQSVKDYKIRKDGNVNFLDLGNDFINSKKYYQNDLDIFGSNSIYQYICVAKTPHGRAQLAALLDNTCIDYQSLEKNQEAVKELGSDFSRQVEIEGVLRSYDNNLLDKRLSNTKNALNLISNEVSFNKYYGIICALLFILTVVISIVSKFDPIKVMSLLFLNFIVCQFLFNSINELSQNMSVINKQFYKIDKIVEVMTKYEFKSKKLIDLQSDLALMSGKEIKQFNRLNSLIASRANILFQLIFNSTIFIDYFLLYFYKSWQKKNNDNLSKVLQAIGEFESLMSLAVINYTKEGCVMPTISTKFEFGGITHPLMDEKKAISNDFKFEGLNIITGSNMSGKTTFMRSIGSNYILFKAGGYVCAKTFSAPIAKLYTSMRVVDDMSNGISTFYGEILRIKDIVEAVNKKEEIIVLIDEIFKGTNTIDRIEGASSVASILCENDIISIITTHDFELCSLDNVKNYHFLEYYKDNKIYFDYSIKSGRSQTKNAIYLLKMAGVIK